MSDIKKKAPTPKNPPRAKGQPYGYSSEPKSNNLPYIIGGGVAAVVILVVVAVLLTRGGSGSDKVEAGTGASAAKNATQQVAKVTVSGEDLPEYPADANGLTDASNDKAIGVEIPGLAGQSFDGSKVTIDPKDGKPKVIMFIAHWCPHCQAEVPLVQQYLAEGKAPKGVDFYAVSTSVDDSKPNYPPSSWLAKVGWQPKTMLDDANSTAATSYALPGFPYFVLVGADGKVVQRGSGELPIDDFAKAVDQLAPSGASTTTSVKAAT